MAEREESWSKLRNVYVINAWPGWLDAAPSQGMLGYPRFWGYVAPLWLLLPMAGKERQKVCLPSSIMDLVAGPTTFLSGNRKRGNLLRKC
jgi:hypothetical protein